MGFLNYVSRLLPDRKPGRFYAALDNDWRPAFRVEALPSYKTHRVAGPEDEPDVVATIAARTDERVEVVTGDRDLFAIVRDPRVKVLYTLKGVTELAEVTEG